MKKYLILKVLRGAIGAGRADCLIDLADIQINLQDQLQNSLPAFNISFIFLTSFLAFLQIYGPSHLQPFLNLQVNWTCRVNPNIHMCLMLFSDTTWRSYKICGCLESYNTLAVLKSQQIRWSIRGNANVSYIFQIRLSSVTFTLSNSCSANIITTWKNKLTEITNVGAGGRIEEEAPLYDYVSGFSQLETSHLKAFLACFVYLFQLGLMKIGSLVILISNEG